MSSMVAKCIPLRPIFRVGNSKSYAEQDPEITVVGWWQECFSRRGIAAQQAMCGSVRTPRKAFLSSPNHRNLQISLRVTFGFQQWQDRCSKCVCVCVLVCARVLLWRWLGKRCHMSNHYIGIPHFRELFDCPSYTEEFFNMMKTGSRMTAWHKLKNVAILFIIILCINWSERFVKWSNLLPLIVNIKEIQLIGIKEKKPTPEAILKNMWKTLQTITNPAHFYFRHLLPLAQLRKA